MFAPETLTCARLQVGLLAISDWLSFGLCNSRTMKQENSVWSLHSLHIKQIWWVLLCVCGVCVKCVNEDTKFVWRDKLESRRYTVLFFWKDNRRTVSLFVCVFVCLLGCGWLEKLTLAYIFSFCCVCKISGCQPVGSWMCHRQPITTPECEGGTVTTHWPGIRS